MEKKIIETFKCEICNTTYSSEEQALECESRPVTQDKSVKVGDIIKITKGDGAGEKAKVEDIFIYSKDWGHYLYETYWHTVGISAKLIDSWGNRQLTFSDYEKI